MTWKHGTWLGLDVETTGLQAGKDRVVQVGAARMVADASTGARELGSRAGVHEIVDHLLNPGIPIPESATAVHGITDADVADALTWDEDRGNGASLADNLISEVRRADALVGYNWPFDAGFLEAELGQRWTEAIEGKPILDPLVVVRFDDVGRYWRGKGRHKLEAVAARLGVERPHGKAHTAGYDAALALNVLDKLAVYLPDDGAEATALIERERKRQDENFKAWLSRQKARDAAQEGA